MASSQGISAGGAYNTDMQIYRTLVSKKMERAAWKKSIWTPFIGIIDTDRYQKLPKYASKYALKPTGKPIEVLKDFMNGGVDMDVPVFYPLNGSGVYGGKQLLGNEEAQTIGYKRVSVNQIRHGVLVTDNKMSKQALSDPRVQAELMKGASEKLADWFSRWISYQPYMALLEGHGIHQTAAASSGGLGLSVTYHPNFYVAGSGRVTWNVTTSSYKSNIITGLKTLSDTASDKFSVKALRNMVLAANRDHRIQPFDVGGTPLYLVVIHSSQAAQLEQDDEWKNRMLYAAERSIKNNPLFTGLIAGICCGALVMIDDYAPTVHVYNSSGTEITAIADIGTTADFDFGASNFMATTLDTGFIKIAYLLGQSAIAVGYGSQLGFEEETWDYNQKRTEGADMIIGFDRADIYDSDGDFGITAGTKIKENNSSLILATYSPDTFSWS